jgi:S-adenosylmethionine hydrolase
MNLTRGSIFLFTDFTHRGPYVGQLEAAIVDVAPEARVVHLMHDAPGMRPDLAAYLLPPVCRTLPAGSVVVAVVDPGVGGPRRPLVVETPQCRFIGPDNGLFSRLPDIRRVDVIDWQPPGLTPSFHGRDLFAPVAARLWSGRAVACLPMAPDDLVGVDWPGILSAVVYVDGFGNLVTGVDLDTVPPVSRVSVGGQDLNPAETFSKVSPGRPFWYRNSVGLLEISVNRGSAATALGLALGDKVLVDFA